jgi:hypothetical protein
MSRQRRERLDQVLDLHSSSAALQRAYARAVDAGHSALADSIRAAQLQVNIAIHLSIVLLRAAAGPEVPS